MSVAIPPPSPRPVAQTPVPSPPVTSVAFDPSCELLWAGTTAGTVHACAVPSLDAYCSLRGHAEPVLGVNGVGLFFVDMRAGVEQSATSCEPKRLFRKNISHVKAPPCWFGFYDGR